VVVGEWEEEGVWIDGVLQIMRWNVRTNVGRDKKQDWEILMGFLVGGERWEVKGGLNGQGTGGRKEGKEGKAVEWVGVHGHGWA